MGCNVKKFLALSAMLVFAATFPCAFNFRTDPQDRIDARMRVCDDYSYLYNVTADPRSLNHWRSCPDHRLRRRHPSGDFLEAGTPLLLFRDPRHPQRSRLSSRLHHDRLFRHQDGDWLLQLGQLGALHRLRQQRHQFLTKGHVCVPGRSRLGPVFSCLRHRSWECVMPWARAPLRP